MSISATREKILNDGFAIIDDVFTDVEINHLIELIEKADSGKPSFRKSADLFAIRRFFKEVPDSFESVFNNNLFNIIYQLLGDNYFVVKSIYFDKPGESNWFVAYHQDLTISVDKKKDIPGYGSWTVKQSQYAVQPPLNILQQNFTIRIHLDTTTPENGALKVIPRSHLKGVYRPETIDWAIEEETTCCVAKGGIMIMKPLLLHSSGRTTNNSKRRVIHIEFSSQKLAGGLEWAERIEIN